MGEEGEEGEKRELGEHFCFLFLEGGKFGVGVWDLMCVCVCGGRM